MLAKLAVAARLLESWFICLQNLGFGGALRLLVLSHFGSRLQRIWIRSMGRSFWFRGRQDRKTLHVLYSANYHVLDNDTNPIRYIVDGGANIGDQTLRFRHFYPAARIVAIEPEPENFAVLTRNFADDEMVDLVQAAVWDRSGEVGITFSDSSVSHAVSGSDTGRTVGAVTIPELMERFSLPRIDILKLDVEGAEVEIFNSAQEWCHLVNSVIVEPHDRMRGGCGFAVIRPFLELGYDFHVNGENIILIKRGLGWTSEQVLYYEPGSPKGVAPRAPDLRSEAPSAFR